MCVRVSQIISLIITINHFIVHTILRRKFVINVTAFKYFYVILNLHLIILCNTQLVNDKG
jgi:hypothetical protein